MKRLLLFILCLFLLGADRGVSPPVVAVRPLLSANNSTIVPLSADAVFTGTTDDIAAHSMITIFVFTDQDSAVNGLSMEFSVDGTNWDRKKTVSIDGGRDQVHTLSSVAQYFRVVYTNGSVGQTEFRMSVKYHPYQSKHLTTSATETIFDQNDVELVRPSSTHDLDVGRGLVSGHSWVNKFGRNDAVGTTEEAIWVLGGDYTGFLTSGTQLEVVSTDIDDDSDGAGTNAGAHKVTIEGLDSNFVFQTETVTLNGTGVVTTTETDWIRVNRAYVTEVGTYSTSAPSTTGANEGTVTIRVVSAGATVAQLSPQVGQTQLAIYTVPAGKTAYLRRVYISVSSGANKGADVKFWQRRNADDVTTPFSGRRLIQYFDDVQGDESETFDYSVSFPEKTDLWWSAIRSGSSDSEVDVDFELMVVPNDQLPAIP